MVPDSSEDVTRAMRGQPKRRFSRNYLRRNCGNVILYVLVSFHTRNAFCTFSRLCLTRTKALLAVRRGVNRGMQIRRSMPFFRQIRQSANIFAQIRKVNVNATVTSNFAQIVKKVTCLMTITQYNSNNSLTPEFK